MADDSEGERLSEHLNHSHRRGEFPPTRDEEELVDDEPSGPKVAAFAVAIAIVMGALFYGLNNVDLNKPQIKCPEGYICTKVQ